MNRLNRIFKTFREESTFIREQFGKIIWPTPSEAVKIFGWTSMMLLTFAILITFVFDPISIEMIKFLSNLQ